MDRFETEIEAAKAVMAQHITALNARDEDALLQTLHFPHHRLGTLMPTVTLTDGPMWLRGVDGTNDSPMPGQADRLRAADGDQVDDLRKRFGLNLGAIAASF